MSMYLGIVDAEGDEGQAAQTELKGEPEDDTAEQPRQYTTAVLQHRLDLVWGGCVWGGCVGWVCVGCVCVGWVCGVGVCGVGVCGVGVCVHVCSVWYTYVCSV